MLSSKGYLLKYDEKSDSYEIHHEHYGAFAGPINLIMMRAVAMGIELDEFRLAMQEMTQNDHNLAHFGMLGKFIFSQKKDKKSA